MPLGLHGRTHHTPARHVYVVAEWLGNEYEMRIHGVIEETSIFGEQLRLTRTITNRLGESGIDIRDIVENIGFNRSPHMMLYHFNFGFPLMSESTTSEWPDGVEARDPGYGPDGIGTWQAPDAEITEQVYYHSLKHGADSVDAGNSASVVIRNPAFPNGNAEGIKVEVTWDTETLPRMVQWRMPGAGIHVLGAEPSNCWVSGRVAERQSGTLCHLEPGQSAAYGI